MPGATGVLRLGPNRNIERELTWATIALITFVLGYMLTDTADGGGREQVVLSTLVAAGVVAVAVVRDRLGKNAPHDAVTRS